MSNHISLSFVSLIALYWRLGTGEQGQLQSELRLTKVIECNEKQNTWHIQNISIDYHYPRTYLNAAFNVTEEIKKISKLQLDLERCNDQGFNCEDFQVWKIDHFCNFLTWRNQIWSSFVDAIHPPFRCPVKKIVYELRNGIFDVDALLKWYPEMPKYAWRVTCRISNELNRLVYCAIFEAHVYQYRKRNRKPKI